jgi:phosphate transport system substrate-binding protein
MNKIQKFTSLAAVVAFSATAAFAQIKVDPALKPYTPVSGVSGNLNSIGSDTLNNLMTLPGAWR